MSRDAMIATRDAPVSKNSTTFTSDSFRRYTIRTAIYVLLIVGVMLFLLPVYVVIVTSLKEPAVINLATTWDLPPTIYWYSYVEVMDSFGPRIWNSVSLVISATVL